MVEEKQKNHVDIFENNQLFLYWKTKLKEAERNMLRNVGDLTLLTIYMKEVKHAEYELNQMLEEPLQ